MARRLSSKKAHEIWGECKDKYEDAEANMLTKQAVWMERAAMYRGLQTSKRDGQLYMDVEPTGEAREIQNYIRSFVRAAVASRAGAFPNPEVPAASGDEAAMTRARATEKLLKSFVDDNTFDKEELVRSLIWACTIGGSWIKITWDQNAGRLIDADVEGKERTVTDPETGEEYTEFIQETDMFGAPITSSSFEGRIKTEFVDTMDGLPDPTAKRFCEMRYWIHRKDKASEELEEMFPEDYFGNKTEGRFTEEKNKNLRAAKSFLAGDGEAEDSIGGRSKHNEKTELVEYWEKPSTKNPNGMLCVWSGAVLLYLGPCPFVPARLPVVLLLGDNIVPSGLYADGTVEDLIPLQRTLNRIESKKREYVDNVATPHIMNPLGSRVDPDLFGDIPGQIIDHAPGLKPWILEIPNMPNAAFTMPADIIQRMKEISGYPDVVQGNNAQGDLSGRAIAFLRENEQNVRQSDKSIYQKAILDMFRQMMWVAKQFYEEGRIIRTLGESEEWEFREFNDDDYDWYIDLAPEASSGAPNSRALRYAEVTEGYGLGLFDPENPGAKEARKLLGWSNANSSTSDPHMADRSLARMENMQFEDGDQINEVRDFHNDEVHLEEHNKMRNSAIYLNKSKQEQLQIDYHCFMHEQQLAMKMGVYGDRQMAMGGQPPMPQIPGQPGMESPLTGGAPAGEAPPQSQDQYIEGEVAAGGFSRLGEG